MREPSSRHRAVVAALACVLVLAACGGSERETVLARVGTTAITERTVDRRVALISVDASVAARRSALAALIRAQWLIQEANASNLNIASGELQEQIDSDTQSVTAQLRDLTDRARPSTAEIELEARAQLAAMKIRRRLLESVPPATAREVAAYYRAHRSAYLIPERRYFYIDNLKSQAAALKVKAQVEAGRSFAQMALSEERTSAESFVPGREAIDRAILTAKPNVLSGPFLMSDVGDHSLFEITKIVPPSYRPLPQVERTIARQIVSARRRREVAAFVKTWVARWKARTSCASGYVIQECRQHGGVLAQEAVVLSDPGL
jgi:hypothetical protein